MQKRTDHMIKRTGRIRHAPLRFEAKAELAEVAVMAGWLYGDIGRPPPPKVRQAVRAQVLRAIWPGAGTDRCVEIAFTLLLKGHRLDPAQAADYSCIMQLRRVVNRCPTAKELVQSTWRATKDDPKVAGTVSRVRAIVDSVGWRWDEFDCFSTG